MSAEETPGQPPFLRVVRGDATPEEVAAIVAVLAALRSPAAAPRKRRSEWSHPRRSQRVTLRRGPGGWRSSSLPG